MDPIYSILLLVILPGTYGDQTTNVWIYSESVSPRDFFSPYTSAYFAEGENATGIIHALPYCGPTAEGPRSCQLSLFRVSPSYKLIGAKLGGIHRFWNVTAIPTLDTGSAGLYRCSMSNDPGAVSASHYILNIVKKPVMSCRSSYEVEFGGNTAITIEASGTIPATITRDPPIGNFEVMAINDTEEKGVRRWSASLLVDTYVLEREFDVTFTITYHKFRCSHDETDPNRTAFQRCASIPTSDTCTTTIFVRHSTCPATTVLGLNRRIMKANTSAVVSNFSCSNNMVISNNVTSIICKSGSWSKLPKCSCLPGRKCAPDFPTISRGDIAGLLLDTSLLFIGSALLTIIIIITIYFIMEVAWCKPMIK